MRTDQEKQTARTTTRTWWLTAGSVLVAAALAASFVFVFFRGDDQVTPDPDRVAELEASADARNVAQVGGLVELTRAAHEELLPVLESLDGVLPADGSPPPDDAPAADDEIDDWLAAVDGAGERFAASESGDTGYNVTHAGLGNSVDLLGSSVVAYSSAQRARDGERGELQELAADLRDQAVRAWSVAATQLDVVSVEAGHGHVHLYLPAAPGSGALEPDSAEEGAEASPDDGHDH